MAKFKIGDRVIAKENTPYEITTNGWKGVVVELYGNTIRAKDVTGDAGFIVDPKYFDLDTTTDQKIVITTDGTTTTAKMYHGKTVAKAVESKCNPDDRFDFETGAKLAFNRLLGADVPEDNGGFKAGDVVRITDAGLIYPTYCYWIITNIKDVDKIAHFAYNGKPATDARYQIIAIAKHDVSDTTLAYIQKISMVDGACYLIGVEGLEKW